MELSLTLVKEFRREKTEGKNRGLKLRLLDITAAMVVGPDGHPNHYGHWSPENMTLAGAYQALLIHGTSSCFRC